MATVTLQWIKYMRLETTKQLWKDEESVHRFINEGFSICVDEEKDLKEYRDWIESNIFGFGERSFIWMWKLLVDEMPPYFSFLEIGVFRGQILGLIRMLADRSERGVRIIGVTPLDSSGGHWESDYNKDIKHLHDTFNLKQPEIIKGMSTDEGVVRLARGSYDIIYIDGGHDYETVKSDIKNYAPMVKNGGYLVIDDCANKYSLPNGYFKGIESVSKAVDELLPNEYYKEVFSVVHNRVFKRIK